MLSTAASRLPPVSSVRTIRFSGDDQPLYSLHERIQYNTLLFKVVSVVNMMIEIHFCCWLWDMQMLLLRWQRSTLLRTDTILFKFTLEMMPKCKLVVLHVKDLKHCNRLLFLSCRVNFRNGFVQAPATFQPKISTHAFNLQHTGNLIWFNLQYWHLKLNRVALFFFTNGTHHLKSLNLFFRGYNAFQGVKILLLKYAGICCTLKHDLLNSINAFLWPP